MGNRIVYEYTDKTGGLKGNRYIGIYDKSTFIRDFGSLDATTSKDGRLIVIAKGLELKAAQKLCEQVSLITQIMGELQGLSHEITGVPDLDMQ